MTWKNFDDLWNFSKPDATEAALRDLLPDAEASDDRGAHAELLTQIARTQGLQRKFDQANLTLDAAKALSKGAVGRATIRISLERGRILNSSGSPAEAKPHFVEAYEQAVSEQEDALAVDAAHMVAIAAEGDDIMAWNQKALDLANRSDDPRARRWRGSLFNNIGWSHHDRKDYEAALENFEAALAARRESGDAEQIRIAEWCVARAYRSIGRLEAALSIHRDALKAYEALGERPRFTYEEIAECLLALDRGPEAALYFRQAYAALAEDPWFVANEADRLERLRQLGEGA